MKFEKNIKIGKFNIISLDWFEYTKFLGVFAGVNVSGVFLGIMLIKNDYKPLISLLLSITCFALFLISSKAINLLRDLNPDKVNVRVNGND